MHKLRMGLAMLGLTTLSGVRDVSMTHGGSHWAKCQTPDTTEFVGPTVISDFADGVSSDGRGPYFQGAGGIVESAINTEAVLTFYYGNDTTVTDPRAFKVNLNHPVPDGGGRPLGIITQRGLGGSGILAQLPMVGDSFQNLNTIPVGRTVKAAQLNVTVKIDGRFHALQMGPQPIGHCVGGGTRVNGDGTSSGTIYRSSQTKWVVDLPSGSVGRLFELGPLGTHDFKLAVDKGLYYVHLHYEIGK